MTCKMLIAMLLTTASFNAFAKTDGKVNPSPKPSTSASSLAAAKVAGNSKDCLEMHKADKTCEDVMRACPGAVTKEQCSQLMLKTAKKK